MTRRPAVDCLRRAGLSLRANWALIPLTLVQNLVAGGLFLLSFVPPFLVLGGRELLEREWTAAAFEEWLLGLGASMEGRLVPIALAIVASIVIGFLAVFVWGWFQGGVFGTLVAAERQALPDAQNRAGGAQWFRTFGRSEFSGWGGRYAWRYFWFFHLSMTVGLVLLLVVALLMVGVGFGYEAWGGAAAYGIGCGASLPLFFVFLVYVLWTVTTRPFLALPEGSVGRASGAGLRLIGRRPGAVALVIVTVLIAAIAIAVGLWVVEASVGLAAAGSATLLWGFIAVLAFVRLVIDSALSAFGNAAFTSLAVAEAPEVVR